MQDISNLLTQVNLIQQKYDEFAEYTGENFNVFEILSIYSNEISHSSFIANLLNTKGKHGQKDRFLRLFIEEVKDLFTDNTKLEALDFAISKATTEAWAGKVDHENIEGGRIDILITDGVNKIIIENKVWAGDQLYQLVRYNNNDKNAPIIYLTLNGKEPTDQSKGSLQIGQDFICVSYEKHVVNWLANCIKEMANKPIIRETLNQYLHLVKQLTHQTPNNKMNDEILELILKNDKHLASATIIRESYDAVLREARLRQTKILQEFLKNKGIASSIERALRDNGGDGLYIPILELPRIGEKSYEMGINIEISNDYYFFCVAEVGNNRSDRINHQPQFSGIRKQLQSIFASEKLVVHGWTLGKANSFRIGVNYKNWLLPSTDNSDIFEEFAEKILLLKERVYNDFQDYH